MHNYISISDSYFYNLFLKLSSGKRKSLIFLSILVIVLFCFLDPAMCMVLFLFATSLYIIYSKTKNIYILKLFYYGTLIKFICAIIIFIFYYLTNINYELSGYSVPYSRFFLGDGGYYLLRGLWLHKFLLGSLEYEPYLWNEVVVVYGQTFFVDLVAFFISQFGFSPLSIYFINCILGSFIPISIYFITLKYFDKKTARYTSLACMFWPSLFVLSLFPLKDVWFIFFIIQAIYFFLGFLESKKIYTYLNMICFLYLAYLIRPIFPCAILSIYFTLPCIIKLTQLKMIKSLLLALIIFIYCLAVIPEKTFSTIQSGKNKILNIFARHIGHVHSSEPGKAYKYLDNNLYLTKNPLPLLNNFTVETHIKNTLKSCIHFMYEPFFWEKGKGHLLIFYPEVVILYLLLPFVLMGILISFNRGSISYMLLTLALLIVSTAIPMGNIGTTVRMRALFIPFYLAFGLEGFLWIKQRSLLWIINWSSIIYISKWH